MIEFIRKKCKALYYLIHKEGWRTYVRINGSDWKTVKMGLDNDGISKWFCADPFLFEHEGKTWLFYESVTKKNKGVLGCFELVDDRWIQRGIVLEEPWHLSYPQVFEYDGRVYMIPESNQSGKVSMYEATDFPRGWVKRADIIDGIYSDCTILHYQGCWYLWCLAGLEHSELWIASELFGPWKKHPMSSMINQSNRLRRCGGRFLRDDDQIYRIAQDCNGCYGKRVFKVHVDKMGPTEYQEGFSKQIVGRSDRPIGWKHTYNILDVNGSHYEVIDKQHMVIRSLKEVWDVLVPRLRRRFA